MLSTKIRIAGVLGIISITSCWLYLTNGVWGDYQDLVNRTDEVQLSVLTLLISFGGFTGVLFINISCIISVYAGKQTRIVIGDDRMVRLEKIAIYGVLLGIVLTVVFSLYSMKLLNEYGYEFNYNLTKITPTGIHLKYIKTP
ncbi:hypothetical protein [Aliivibrio fischeri]|uniref:hypothetical protein n=1 Tax=Aliivibrio fischeri TaxID=668 RepID=UPI0012DA7DF0|nr:hypothetical protein [Aliivibrio fischeri]MUL11666.1 hypothetical protein [Aliivibrio fischeri]MUL15499.1 hypothetical protein [Aliivibrio fischeri]